MGWTLLELPPVFFSAAPKLAFKGVFPRSVVYSEHVIRLKEKGAVVARWF